MTTLDQIVAADPVNPEFDGTSVTWRFTNHEPPINPSLTVVRPSLWGDLNNKRRAAQSHTDANASAALGNLLRQLALIDSPRRDSFYAQAIAELETAVRLDPNQRGARQALASLYESRAGAAVGPRQPAYVLLAVAQWELLSADLNARKQLAEDYFYLGLDAQTRRAFADAQTYFDKAQALAPAGAGPLFTPAHLAAQRRALNIAWAHALIDRNDAAGARDKARAALDDKFMASFNPPPFNISRTQVHMTSDSRSMAFTLVPYSAAPAEVQNALSGAAASLRAAGADVAFNDSSLRITVQFADDVELTDRLAALEKALPNGPEWSIVRAVLSPRQIAWEDTDELLTHATRYREDVDLSAACGAFSAQVDAAARNLSPLDGAPSNDDEAQLKRALLKYAQAGWQDALAQSRVSYQVGANQARVGTCAAHSVTIATSTFLPLRVALIVGVIEFVGIGILIARWMGRRQRRQRPKSL
jgi:tetratricopeptide (TPR) repeat protein